MLAQNPKLLIVDDEANLRKALSTALVSFEFKITEARNGEEALDVLKKQTFEATLLDINMPGITGFETCRRIRQFAPNTGIIMVTVRDSEEDQVRALEAGADDFVTKPYRLRELVARIRAVLRRLNGRFEVTEPILRAGSLALDLERRLLTKDGIEIHLSPKEFDILAYLFQHAGAPVLHAKLLHAVWGPEYGRELEYLRSYIKMLRKKIERDPARPEYLLTEPWVGYRFRDPNDSNCPMPE